MSASDIVWLKLSDRLPDGLKLNLFVAQNVRIWGQSRLITGKKTVNYFSFINCCQINRIKRYVKLFGHRSGITLLFLPVARKFSCANPAQYIDADDVIPLLL